MIKQTKTYGDIRKNNFIFDGELASMVGIPGALLYNWIKFFVEKNAEDKTLHNTMARDGYVWMYGSAEKFQQHFDFLSVATVKRALTKLANTGLILKSRSKARNGKLTANWYTIPALFVDDNEQILTLTNPHNAVLKCGRKCLMSRGISKAQAQIVDLLGDSNGMTTGDLLKALVESGHVDDNAPRRQAMATVARACKSLNYRAMVEGERTEDTNHPGRKTIQWRIKQDELNMYDPKKDEALEYVSKWIEQQRSIKDD